MSSTQIFGFRKSGNAFHIGDVWNSHRGAPMIWEYIEKKYLPPRENPPAWLLAEQSWSRWNYPQENMHEIWEAWKRPDVSAVDKICLMSTLDNVVVLRENFRVLVSAFYAFQGQSSLKEQGVMIDNVGQDVIAVAWNQTSVTGDPLWYQGEKSGRPYNILRQRNHWLMFEHLGEIRHELCGGLVEVKP